MALADIPGYGAYVQRRAMNEAAPGVELKQVGALQSLLMNAEKAKQVREANVRAESMRGALAGLQEDATPDQVLAAVRPYADADTILKATQSSADRRATNENTKQIALQRLAQQASVAQMAHERALAAAQTQQERNAEIARHNRVKEALDAEARAVAGQRLFYDTGLRTPGVQVPQEGPPAAPQGMPQQDVVGFAGTDAEAIQRVRDASKRGLMASMTVDPQMAETLGGMTQPAPAAAPQVAPAVPSVPAPRDNLDARDLALRNMTPQPPRDLLQRPGDQAPAVPVAAAPGGLPEMPPEIKAAPPKVQDRWKVEQIRQSNAGSGTLRPETLDFLAQQYLTGDRQAIQGFARSATARIAIQNAIVDKAAQMGMSPQETAARIAEFQGTVAASRSVGQRAANISLAANEAQQMLAIVKEQSDKFPRQNFIPWNYALRAYETGTGSPEIAAFGASVNALVNVYARAINPTGQPTVSDKEHARAVLNTIQSPEQVDAVLGIIRRELEIAKKAPSAVRSDLRSSVTGGGNVPPPPSGFTIDKTR